MTNFHPDQFRIWDGTTWALVPDTSKLQLDETLVTGTSGGGAPPPPTGSTTTSTSLSGGGTQNGGSRTLTATVSPSAAAGTVQFKKGSSVVSTKTVSSGKATYSAGEGTYTATFVPSSSAYKGSSSGSQTVTIRTLTTKTTTQNAKWVQAYNGDGGQISGSGNDGAWHQGYYSGTHGNRRSLIGFSDLNVADLDSITNVEFTITIDHAYYGSGLDLDLGWHENTGSTPATYRSANPNKAGYNRGTGTRTIDITSWAKSLVTRNDFGGIVIGGTANLSHYGYGNGSNTACKLKVTYKQWT